MQGMPIGDTVEYFNLGVRPIFRKSYSLGEASIPAKISVRCIGCVTCMEQCPVRTVEARGK